jgi:hypothetical protein
MRRFLLVACIVSALLLPAGAAPRKSAPDKKVTIELPSKPANGPMGIGVFLGQPSGITFEMDMSASSWLDFKAAWNLAGGNNGFSILLQGNYEYAFPGMITMGEESLTPFVGVGAVVNVYDGGIGLGARVPAGVSYRFRTVPLELFLELGLDVYLFPATDIGFSGGLGARYRF